mgnify:FL=1
MLHTSRLCQFLLLLALAPSAVAQTFGYPAELDIRWEEASSRQWVEFSIVSERAIGEDVDYLPWYATRRTTVYDPSGNVRMTIDTGNVALIDFTGDGQEEMVVSGNSGGVSGCCDFLDVYVAQGSQLTSIGSLNGDGRNVRLQVTQLDDEPGREVVDGLTLGVSGIPYCCHPVLKQVWDWNGTSLVNATSQLGAEMIQQDRQRFRTDLENMGVLTVDDLDVLSATIGYVGASLYLGLDEYRAALSWFDENAPTPLQVWLNDQLYELKGIVAR